MCRVAFAILISLTVAASAQGPRAGTPLPSISADARSVTDRQAASDLDAKLDAPIGKLQFPEDVSLREAFQIVADRLGAGLIIDHAALTDQGISLDQPAAISISLGGTPVSARTVLKLLGNSQEIAVLNRAGLLVVTTKYQADERLVTRVYDVRELLDGVPARPAPLPMVTGAVVGIAVPLVPKDSAMPLSAENQLINLLQLTTGGQWFDTHGAGGTLDTYDGLLIVRQTEETHAEVAALLGAIREARSIDRSNRPSSATPSAEAAPPERGAGGMP